MQSFNEWLYLRDKVYYESFIFLEQGGPTVAPKVVEIPEGSGRLFWQIDDPDNPGKKVNILTTSPNAQERALELIQRNKEMGRNAPAGAAPAPGAPPTGTPPTGAPPTGVPPAVDDMDASYINPRKIDARNVQVGNHKMQLSARNMMIKQMIAEKKNTSVSSITDKLADEQLAYMANEEDEKEFMRMDGTKVDLKKIQQQFVDRYGYNKEMQLFNGATQENIRLSPKNWTGITIKAGKLSPRQPAPKGATIIPYGSTGKPVEPTAKDIKAEKEEADRNKLVLQNAYGNDPTKWQKSAQVAAGLAKDPQLNQASVYFMNFFKQNGEDYRQWNPKQQEVAGIDPNIPYYSVKQSKQQDVNAIYIDTTTDKNQKNNLLKQYLTSKNGLMNLNDLDIYHIAYGIRDNTFDKSFLSPKEAKDLLNRDDLSDHTKFYLREIGGIKQQQPPAANKEPAAQTPPPATNKEPAAQNLPPAEKTKRQDEILKELTDIDQQLEEVSDLLILLNSMEATDENIQKIYNNNKAAFDDYADRKKIDKNMDAIVNKLVQDQDSLEKRRTTLEDEAAKLDPQ